MRVLPLRLILFLGLLAVAKGQSVRWDPPGGPLPVGQATALQLVFDDCEPKDTPKPPKVDGLTIEYGGGQSTSMSWTNGTYSHTVSYGFSALLTDSRPVEIPAFDIETSKGRMTVPAARFHPTTATVGGTGESLTSAATSEITATPESVWAGEVFNLDYRIEVGHEYYPDFGHGVFDWKPDPLIAEDWAQPVTFEVTSGASPKTGLAYRTRAIIRAPGLTPIKPIRQAVNLSIGMSGLGFFQQRQYQQFSVTSSAPVIDVRPLPPAPSGFSGAVGQFTLTSKIGPAGTAVGEPITWTLELKGKGNWPDISGLPEREVSKDFQVVQPKARRTNAAGKLFECTLSEDVVLIPTKPGIYDLEPVSLVYFDPKDGSYKTLTAPGATVTVTAPATAPAGAQDTAPGSQGLTSPGGGTGPAATPPAPPAGLPRDALPNAGSALQPWSLQGIVLSVLSPFILVLLFWLGLALRRARQTDPSRARREARLRLGALLAKAGTGAVPTELLVAWQRDAAILWGLSHAAPSAGDLTANGSDAAWQALWAESERAIYGPDLRLPNDWVSRATAALSAKPAPAFAARLWFSPRNLLPWFYSVAIVLLAGIAATARADESETGSAAYRRGDFAAAESAWRNVVKDEPANWSARYNLSLALAQQDRWQESAAQASAALVQQPGNEAVRWQFALACGKAGYVPAPLAPFVAPGPIQSIAGFQSPAGWQATLIAAAWAAAAALAALIARGYRRHRAGAGSGAVKAALIVLALAFLTAIGASFAWSAYGIAANERAVVSWRDTTLYSIPTEADTSQKTVPLNPGSVALCDKSFLTWTRLSFENGQTGWVRREEVIPLWK